MGTDLVAAIMAGGAGERLRPLTDHRAKPAVPFAGCYRIIDFTLSNCVNSMIRRIFVLTQYKSHSLSTHLRIGWSFLPERLDQFVAEVPAQMQMGDKWYKGTADAIRQNLGLFDRYSPERLLILSGDHVYKMDYRLMDEFHRSRSASASVSVVRVPADEARGRYGVLEVDENWRVVGFQEKPREPKTLPGTNDCLASMGIYIFDFATLDQALDSDHDDFGKEILPAMVADGRPVYAFDFTDRNCIRDYEMQARDERWIRTLADRTRDSSYWRDVGTIEAYWKANLDLVSPHPRFNLHAERWAIFNSPIHFPPAHCVGNGKRSGSLVDSLVSSGVMLSGALVRESVLGPGTHVDSGTIVERSVVMGGSMREGLVDETSIGKNCRIRNAVLDKNVRIPAGTSIGYSREEDEKRGMVTYPISGSAGGEGAYLTVVPSPSRRALGVSGERHRWSANPERIQLNGTKSSPAGRDRSAPVTERRA